MACIFRKKTTIPHVTCQSPCNQKDDAYSNSSGSVYSSLCINPGSMPYFWRMYSAIVSWSAIWYLSSNQSKFSTSASGGVSNTSSSAYGKVSIVYCSNTSARSHPALRKYRVGMHPKNPEVRTLPLRPTRNCIPSPMAFCMSIVITSSALPRLPVRNTFKS